MANGNFWGSQGRFGGGAQNPNYMLPRKTTNYGIGTSTGTFDQNITQLMRERLKGLMKGKGGGGGSLYGGARRAGRGPYGGDSPLWGMARDYAGGQINVPEKYQEAPATEGMIDPAEVIKSYMPLVQEQRDIGWATAAQKLGHSGPTEGTPWAAALAKGQRGADVELANIASKYAYQAASDAAQRQHAADQAARERGYGAWGTHGGWDIDAQRDAARRREWEWDRIWDLENRDRQRMMAELEASQAGDAGLRDSLLNLWREGSI